MYKGINNKIQVEFFFYYKYKNQVLENNLLKYFTIILRNTFAYKYYNCIISINK